VGELGGQYLCTVVDILIRISESFKIIETFEEYIVRCRQPWRITLIKIDLDWSGPI
jgi:hypothetical protein